MKVLIVDDAISQIDSRSKRCILENIEGESNRNIIIISSQRPSLMKKCNKIFVMKDGKILMTGNHESLNLDCELYRNFCEIQGGMIYEV